LFFGAGGEKGARRRVEVEVEVQVEEAEKKIEWITLLFSFHLSLSFSTQAIPPYLDDLADVGAWLLQELELLAEEADCFVLVGLQGGRKKR